MPPEPTVPSFDREGVDSIPAAATERKDDDHFSLVTVKLLHALQRVAIVKRHHINSPSGRATTRGGVSGVCSNADVTTWATLPIYPGFSHRIFL